MRKLIILTLFSLLFMSSYSYTMEEGGGGRPAAAATAEGEQSGRILLYNNTTWKLQIDYMVRGKKLSPIIDPDAELDLGTISDIQSISAKRYGEYSGIMPVSYSVDLDKIKKNPSQSVQITIKSSWTAFYFEQSPLSPEEAQKTLPNNPWKLFPRAYLLIDAGGTVLPHHILNIPKDSNHETIQTAYRYLTTTIHPDKYAAAHPDAGEETIKVVTESFKILGEAKDLLIKQREILDKFGPIKTKLDQLTKLFEEKKSTLSPEEHQKTQKYITAINEFTLYRPGKIGSVFDNNVIPKKIGSKTFKKWDISKINKIFTEENETIQMAHQDLDSLIASLTKP
ncbi:MAG: DnaJ domain-containing protein [bacterium]|nr:DnaJ domain-containing protein [bacterium]